MTFADWLTTLPEAERFDAIERAAIREFDAGQSRAMAEQLTMLEWRTRA